MSKLDGLEHWLTTPPDGEEPSDGFERDIAEENLEIAHELDACGGDCPRCQQERMEQREERLAEFGDPDYPEAMA